MPKWCGLKGLAVPRHDEAQDREHGLHRVVGARAEEGAADLPGLPFPRHEHLAVIVRARAVTRGASNEYITRVVDGCDPRRLAKRM